MTSIRGGIIRQQVSSLGSLCIQSPYLNRLSSTVAALQLVRASNSCNALARQTLHSIMGGYRVIELHPSDERLSRWFCLACQEEVQQRGTMAPACPARLAHETSPQHLAAVARKAAVLQPRPQNLLQQRVDARQVSAPDGDAQRRAAKRAKQMHNTAQEQRSPVSSVAAPALSSVANMLDLWLLANQLNGDVHKQRHVGGEELLTCVMAHVAHDTTQLAMDACALHVWSAFA